MKHHNGEGQLDGHELPIFHSSQARHDLDRLLEKTADALK